MAFGVRKDLETDLITGCVSTDSTCFDSFTIPLADLALCFNGLVGFDLAIANIEKRFWP